MPKVRRIGLRQVRTLAPGDEIWDLALPNFGARRRKGPSVSYFVFYRNAEGVQKRHTIGRHGAPWTPDTARDEARRVLTEKAKGNDPAAEKIAQRRAATVADLCDTYMADTLAGALLTRRRVPKKARTARLDQGRIVGHIKPLIGHMKVAAVTRGDVEAFMQGVWHGKTAADAKSGKVRGLSSWRGGKAAASRTMGLLGSIFSYAIRRGLRADNPCSGVVRPADGRRDRRLTDDEYVTLGTALRAAADRGVWPAAIAVARFITLTGWRNGEALALQWEHIDLVRRTATLPDTKTGRSMRPLSHAACDVLGGLPRIGSLVFPATRGEGQMTGFYAIWMKLAHAGGLPADVSPHVLRHSFASVAADLGYAESTIATLIGHVGRSMTSRYVHSADAVLLAAADAVARRIATLLGDAATADVVPLRGAA